MKKTILKSALLAVACIGLMAGNSLADMLPGEYQVVNPDTTIKTTYDASNPDDYGYYIWTNETRTVWNVEWTGGVEGGVDMVDFTGMISLYGNTVESSTTYRWENNDTLDVHNDYFKIDAWAGYKGVNWYDGFTFTILNIENPSYVAFDLFINGFQSKAAGHIYLGDSIVNDGDFAVAAPVPEPATMLLFGTGLVGLVGIRSTRRKKVQKA